ncbi:MAG TPA: aspartyl protease family protein [Candidatus Koribacter sp.]|jgi:tetratricopeptide (TPR) repeat protein
MNRLLALLLSAFISTALLMDSSQAQSTPAPGSAPVSQQNSDLVAGRAAFAAGKYDDAAARFRAVLAKEPGSVAAQVALVRTLLSQEKLQEAVDLAGKYLAATPNAAPLHTSMAEVHFRRAEMSAAESDFRSAIRLDPTDTQAYLGLAKLVGALGYHGKAYQLLVTARDLAPDDPDVQRQWIRFLPRSSRIPAMEKLLAENKDGQSDLTGLREYLAFLKGATADRKTHPCSLAKPVERTQTDLTPLLLDAQRLRGWGLNVKLNDHVSKFLLDTGASGIYMGRKQAEKAGVARIYDEHASGIGDQGQVTGYYGYVDRLQVGELEFHDCIVEVSDKKSIVEEEGLIGADVFSNYIVNLDFRERRMRLEPLPKRPGDAEVAKSLNSEGDDAAISDASAAAENKSEDAPAIINIRTYIPRHPPQDRYRAPEMKEWSAVYRFGHELLLPTRINDLNNKLFLIDTGAFNTTFSTTLAVELGKMHRDYDTEVRGISGKVAKIYSTKDADMVFGHLKQRVEDPVTFDLSSISRDAGTEVSGIIGFRVLNLMDVQIDYRDNLVNFEYDPMKLGP